MGTGAVQSRGRRYRVGMYRPLAFTVVYLGEHYVIDVIAGLALAEAVWHAEPAMLPLVRSGLDTLRKLERLVI